jgi:hypothetical protein
MTRRNDFLMLGLIYLAATFFGFAIVRYLYVFLWDVNPTAKDILIAVRVFFSAPILIISGILLIVMFKEDLIHRIFGVVFLLSGIAWAIEIAGTIVEEAACRRSSLVCILGCGYHFFLPINVQYGILKPQSLTSFKPSP